MHMLSAAELESNMVLELPDRELMGALISVAGVNIGSFDSLTALTSIANGSFNNWTISVLDGNHVNLTVSDNLNSNDVTTFCNQVVTVLSATCSGDLF